MKTETRETNAGIRCPQKQRRRPYRSGLPGRVDMPRVDMQRVEIQCVEIQRVAMKRAVLRRVALTCALAGCIAVLSPIDLTAQTVSGVSPVVSSGNYVTSSSPLPNGGRIQTTYYPPANATLPTESNSAMPAPPTFTPQTEVRRISSATDPNQAITGGYETYGNRQVVRATTYQIANANPVQSNVYYDPNQNAGASVPAASTQPTLLQNGGLATQPTQLNWQPVTGGTAVTGNVCSPNYGYGYGYSGTNYPAQQYTGYQPYTTYRPLIPLRKMPGSAYLGQGLYGQPKAYVQGESIRNFFRYVLP